MEVCFWRKYLATIYFQAKLLSSFNPFGNLQSTIVYYISVNEYFHLGKCFFFFYKLYSPTQFSMWLKQTGVCCFYWWKLYKKKIKKFLRTWSCLGSKGIIVAWIFRQSLKLFELPVFYLQAFWTNIALLTCSVEAIVRGCSVKKLFTQFAVKKSAMRCFFQKCCKPACIFEIFWNMYFCRTPAKGLFVTTGNAWKVYSPKKSKTHLLKDPKH